MTEGISYGAAESASAYSTAAAAAAKQREEVSKDEFLKLLTYQLKAQNPLQPYDNQEFASQLAQFSQLEQLSDIRSLLEEQSQTNSVLTQTMANSALPGMLGKTAKALTNSAQFDGENPVSIGYNLPYTAGSGQLSIFDQSGNLVRVLDFDNFTELSKGDHKLTWDGKSASGDTMPAGTYIFAAQFADKNGDAIEASTFSYGKIEAVRFKSDGTRLVIGGSETPLENVFDISTD